MDKEVIDDFVDACNKFIYHNLWSGKSDILVSWCVKFLDNMDAVLSKVGTMGKAELAHFDDALTRWIYTLHDKYYIAKSLDYAEYDKRKSIMFRKLFAQLWTEESIREAQEAQTSYELVESLEQDYVGLLRNRFTELQNRLLYIFQDYWLSKDQAIDIVDLLGDYAQSIIHTDVAHSAEAMSEFIDKCTAFLKTLSKWTSACKKLYRAALKKSAEEMSQWPAWWNKIERKNTLVDTLFKLPIQKT